jgi:hypothetical protein
MAVGRIISLAAILLLLLLAGRAITIRLMRLASERSGD